MNAAKVALIIVVTLVLQVSLFSTFVVGGARPDIVILLAVSAGFVAGPERGAIVGFAAGLSFDILLTTPLGLTALVYCLIGYLVGAVGTTIMRSAWWTAPAVGAAGSAVGMVLYALLSAVLGNDVFRGPSLISIVVLVSVVNAVLAPVAFRALRWARRDVADHRRPAYFARGSSTR